MLENEDLLEELEEELAEDLELRDDLELEDLTTAYGPKVRVWPSEILTAKKLTDWQSSGRGTTSGLVYLTCPFVGRVQSKLT